MASDFTLCIPTLNPGAFASQLVASISSQLLKPDNIFIIDSGSSDSSVEIFRAAGFEVLEISKNEFDHGGTRNIVFQKFKSKFYLFLTQDSIPLNKHSFGNLISPLLENSNCGVSYGRQVPSNVANSFAEHARLFNYPPGEKIIFKGLESKEEYGIKTIFCSNSFAIYRRTAIEGIGYFQKDTLFAEDSLAVARMLESGWLVAYVPTAETIHSHNYSLLEEFSRYFDVGAFHSFNPWLLERYKGATGEGLKFVISEYTHLKKDGFKFILLNIFIRNFIRYSAYRVGRIQRFIPRILKIRMTTNKSYWNDH